MCSSEQNTTNTNTQIRSDQIPHFPPMPEPRDRRVTPPLNLTAAIYARRRRIDPSPFGFSPTATRRGRAPGPENRTPWATVPRGRSRAQSRSVLPAWYPRTPLRDLTVLFRSMERRGIHLGENSEEVQRTPLDRSVGARLEHRCCDDSSVSVKIRTPAGSKVPKIVLNFAEEEEGESELLTPQKKLLNSIDMVEKLVREKLQKLKQSPSGRKAEREKRVRALMSMR